MDRVQRLQGAGGVYPEKCCRASYGIVVRQKYDPIQHQGEDVSIDPRDSKKWAENQVHWFIRQVRDLVPESPFANGDTLGPESVSRAGCEKPIPFEDQSRSRTSPMEDADRHVYPPGLTASQKPETRGCKVGLPY
jgi:hypothetical protein